MRVWLVDDRQGEPSGPLESLLRQLAERGASDLVLLGAGPYRPTLPAELAGSQTDLLVLHAASCSDNFEPRPILDAGIGLLVTGPAELCARFLAWAESYPVSFLGPDPEGKELHLGLRAAAAARTRQVQWQAHVTRLQQRLNDRVIVEKAKGILLQRLGITEEAAYQRLRLLSRRQRRPLRDIAQSLLDTESLLTPGSHGLFDTNEPLISHDRRAQDGIPAGK